MLMIQLSQSEANTSGFRTNLGLLNVTGIEVAVLIELTFFTGWLITGKVVSTKTGDPMEFLTFEDETGIVETTFFPQAYRRFCHIIDRQRPYLLTGKVEEDWGALTLTVDRVERMMR